MLTLDLFGAPPPTKTVNKRKFNERKEYSQSVRLIRDYFKSIASSPAVIDDQLITDILDYNPRQLYFDIFPHHVPQKKPLSCDDILEEIGATSYIGCSTGFDEGVHEWRIPLSSTYPTDKYHYYFGVVTDVDDYVHSNSAIFAQWRGTGYISSTFSTASFSDYFKPKYRAKNAESVRVRLDCEKWTLQVWINEKLDANISCIIDGEYTENEEETTLHSLVPNQVYFPVVGIYKKN